MGQKTAYLQAALLAQSFGRTAWTPPATWWVVCSLDEFDPDATVDSVTEPQDTYTRVAVANSSSEWAAPSGSSPTTVANLNAWAFPAAASDQGTVRSVYLADAETGGNLCYGTAVPGDGTPVTAGSQFIVPAGAFLVREK